MSLADNNQMKEKNNTSIPPATVCNKLYNAPYRIVLVNLYAELLS